MRVVRAMGSRLFRKYLFLFLIATTAALLGSGALQAWTSYHEYTALLLRIQRAEVDAAAARIRDFLQEVRDQLAWTVQVPISDSTIENQRSEALRLLHLVPAITEIARIDGSGH